eukprot:TRINITY_DN27481_c0_g1_i1.p1 TRINITY_DN27481_c0_g1~~TRINITY_DN27481_c0_g1_i1.p1  ORF type:complete len:551 (-),score=77.57 TRINITY_DN27481_c0_g1_i1:685-2337(-)
MRRSLLMCGRRGLDARGSWELSLAALVAVWSRRLHPTAAAYRQTGQLCARSRQWQIGMLLSLQAFEVGLQSRRASFTTAIRMCDQGGQWALGLHLLCDLMDSSTTPHVVCYSAAITACSRAAQWKQSVCLLLAMNSEEVEPNVVSYNATMASFARVARWQDAVWLLGDMSRSELQPDTVSYNTVANACRLGGQSKMGLRLLAGRMATQEDPSNGTLQPDTFTHCNVIAAYKTTSQWARAIDLALDLARRPAAGLDAFSLSAAVAACTRAAQASQAAELVRSHGNAELADSVVYDAAAHACSVGSLWAEALRLVLQMRCQALHPGVPCLAAVASSIAQEQPTGRGALPVLVNAACQRAKKQLLQSCGTASGSCAHDAIVAEGLPRHLGVSAHAEHYAIRHRQGLEVALRVHVIQPVAKKLAKLKHMPATHILGDSFDQMSATRPDEQDPVLASQFGLGSFHTKETLQRLFSPDAQGYGSKFESSSGSDCRNLAIDGLRVQRSRSHGVCLPREPPARLLLASVGLDLFLPQKSPRSPEQLMLSSCFSVGHGG